MKKYLLIAEKPSLMRTIQAVYKAHRAEIPYEITFLSQAGHLVRLNNPDEYDEDLKKWEWETLPINPKNYGGYKYKVIADKTKLVKQIKDEINSKHYDAIISAGDPDEQGCLLINLVLDYVHNTLPVLRYWQNAQTDSMVLSGLLNLRDNNESFLVGQNNCALAKQHSDWLLGMNASRATTLKSGTRIACGRVKSPLLKIIVDRELEIQNFKPTTSYELTAVYEKGFTGTLEAMDEHIPRKFTTQEECLAYASKLSNKATVTSVESKEEKTYAPKLFKLATLQIAASKLGYNADQVLEIAQSLYEKQVMSYPRTSCEYIGSSFNLSEMLDSASVFDDLRDFISKIDKSALNAIKGSKKYINDKELEDSGHYALTPTDKKANISELTADEKQILHLVFRQYVAIFLDPLIQKKTVIYTDINENVFKTTGKTVISKGYTELISVESEDVELPEVKENEILNVKEFKAAEKTTTCPKRYTDGDLINIMENPIKYLVNETNKDLIKDVEGIGTPATRSTIIKQLIETDKYIERKKTKGKAEQIFATELGIYVVKTFGDRDFFSVDLTAEWERKLKEVRKNEKPVSEFEKEMDEYIKQIIQNIKSSNIEINRSCDSSKKILHKCPCGGDIIEGKTKYFCTKWKENNCKTVIFKNILNANITPTDATKLLDGKIITKKLTKDDKTWEQELIFENNSVQFKAKEQKELDILCPVCGRSMILKEKSVQCSGQVTNDCNYGIPREISGATFLEEDLDHLFKGQVITKKMKSKTNTWNQMLKLNAEFTIDFIESPKEEIGMCPICGKKSIVDTGRFYKCEGYKEECSFFVPHNFESPKFKAGEISKADIKTLISGGKLKSRKIKWLSSEKSSENEIKLNNRGNLEIVFDERKNK